MVPAVHTVQKMARETKQKAQFTAIELGLAAFKSDYGDYPPSFWLDPSRLRADDLPELLRRPEAGGGDGRLGSARFPSGFRLAGGRFGRDTGTVNDGYKVNLRIA